LIVPPLDDHQDARVFLQQMALELDEFDLECAQRALVVVLVDFRHRSFLRRRLARLWQI